jgi:hypothetical protein
MGRTTKRTGLREWIGGLPGSTGTESRTNFLAGYGFRAGGLVGLGEGGHGFRAESFCLSFISCSVC